MAKLPTDLSGREVVTALEQVGFVLTRQRGSHVMLRRNEPRARVTVPAHKTIRIGTLRQIIHDAGLSVEEFLQLAERGR